LLCLPERALPAAVAAVSAGTIVGHCSASEPLATLAPHDRFSMHPLMSLIGESTRFEGAVCAIDGSGHHTRALAETLATALGMRPIHVRAEQRALYHAAASIASNYLVTLEWAAERAASLCGISREELVPLVQASLDAWRIHGFAGAITGPVARGDDATVQRQRDAIAGAAPDLLPLFDTMAQTTRVALQQLQDSPP